MKKQLQSNYQKNALWLLVLLIFLIAACFIGIFSMRKADENALLTAEIYQDGKLLQSIALSKVTEPYTITVTGENGCVNVIEVRNNEIGMLSASCPDKLCIHQGFISDALLPITCLPNKLVIQVKEAPKAPIAQEDNKITPDVITY